MRKPRFSDIAVFAADIAEASPAPSITTDVLEWVFTEHSWDTLPPSLRDLILHQTGSDGPEFNFYSDEEKLTSVFHWHGVGILSHTIPRTPGFTIIDWNLED